MNRGWITDDAGVHHLVPSSLTPAGIFTRTASGIVRRLAGRQFDVTFIDQPLMWSPAVRSISRTLVYRPTDTYDEGRKRQLQDAAVSQADGVVATSDEVLRRLRLPAQMPRIVLPNGVDVRHFSSPDRERERIALYVGAIDGRLDAEAFGVLATAFPDWSFHVFGPGAASTRQGPGNVSWRGGVEYERLPEVLASARIGLLPLSSAPVNAGRSPMKLYEYLASGLCVLSSATPTIRENVDAQLLTYSSRDEMVRKFDVLAQDPRVNDSGRRLANSHGWGRKSEQLLSFAEGL